MSKVSFKSHSIKIGISMLAIILLTTVMLYISNQEQQEPVSDFKTEAANFGLDIDLKYIQKSDYTYDGEPLSNVENIVVHYVGNAGSTAIANRNYFDSLATTHNTAASSHFIIGLDGEIIQCVPIDCVSWANGNKYSNMHSITIECCHIDDSGRFNDKTIASLKRLVEFLMYKYDLSSSNVIRHYDVTGKTCPLYFVENPNEWSNFLSSLEILK